MTNHAKREAAVTLGILAATAAIIIIILIAGRPRPTRIALATPRPTLPPTPESTPLPLLVYVTGAVAQPNRSYTLPHDSRVSAAIDAAGGALPHADLSRVNLADRLHDGAQIHVPSITENAVTLPTPVGGEMIFINRATLDELLTLPGVGPAIASRIIDYREANGPFATLEALDAVNGIGPAMLNDLRDRIRFD